MALTRRGRLAVLLAIVVTILGAPALLGYAYLHSIGLYGASDPGRKVEVEIPRGATADEIGQILEDAGVIKSAFGFRLGTFLQSGAESIQAGTYGIPTGLTARDALEALLSEGPAGEPHVTVTFPEGSWLTDFARAVDKETDISGDKFLNVVTTGKVRSKYQPADVDTLEGLLFPSTYQVVASDTAVDLARRLVGEFEDQVGDLDFSAARAAGLDEYEVMIVASMIEAETRVDSERSKVSRVIYNRLDAGMQLGIDATISYALGRHESSLTESDLAVESPYNTRLVTGLPPTPIGAPGLASIKAALNPADGDWTYYVLHDCEGHHAFSSDYDQFLSDKAVYQNLDC